MMSQLFLQSFQLEVEDMLFFWRPQAFFGLRKAMKLEYFVFFVGLRPFWDFLA